MIDKFDCCCGMTQSPVDHDHNSGVTRIVASSSSSSEVDCTRLNPEITDDEIGCGIVNLKQTNDDMCSTLGSFSSCKNLIKTHGAVADGDEPPDKGPGKETDNNDRLPSDNNGEQECNENAGSSSGSGDNNNGDENRRDKKLNDNANDGPTDVDEEEAENDKNDEELDSKENSAENNYSAPEEPVIKEEGDNVEDVLNTAPETVASPLECIKKVAETLQLNFQCFQTDDHVNVLQVNCAATQPIENAILETVESSVSEEFIVKLNKDTTQPVADENVSNSANESINCSDSQPDSKETLEATTENETNPSNVDVVPLSPKVEEDNSVTVKELDDAAVAELFLDQVLSPSVSNEESENSAVDTTCTVVSSANNGVAVTAKEEGITDCEMAETCEISQQNGETLTDTKISENDEELTVLDECTVPQSESEKPDRQFKEDPISKIKIKGIHSKISTRPRTHNNCRKNIEVSPIRIRGGLYASTEKEAAMKDSFLFARTQYHRRCKPSTIYDGEDSPDESSSEPKVRNDVKPVTPSLPKGISLKRKPGIPSKVLPEKRARLSGQLESQSLEDKNVFLIEKLKKSVGSALSITIKKKKDVPTETQSALEQLSKMSEISATRISRNHKSIPSTSCITVQKKPLRLPDNVIASPIAQPQDITMPIIINVSGCQNKKGNLPRRGRSRPSSANHEKIQSSPKAIPYVLLD